ncbi:unnamed protein product [Adineta steineri]|uniref:Uncharacterized protein n=2 Tax=Adineta steineri TaxID=433720 RepID=A0A820LIB8_9BILA|nr:unnamed protein product [Adineta steineri]
MHGTSQSKVSCITYDTPDSQRVNILDRHLTFNEYEILNDNQQYIQRELKLNELHIIKTDDAVNINNTEDITPGYYNIIFSC